MVYSPHDLELDGDVKNESVFGEEIVVKDMHTRKALMNKLVCSFAIATAEQKKKEERKEKKD